jgi:hypothetical protein
MRNLILALFLFITLCSFSVSDNNVIVPANNIGSLSHPAPGITLPLEKIASMTIKETEKIFGRKLTIREKIAFKIAQHKIKKVVRSQAEGKESKGQTAFILSLIGLCLLIVPYANIASLPLAIIGLTMGIKAKKENPKDTKAQTAIILSIVTLGLIVLGVIAIIIWLAAWSSWW